MKLPRETYLPRDAAWTRCNFPEAALELYRYDSAGRFYALGFFGKAQKPAFHYRFRDEARRVEFIKQQVANGTALRTAKAARTAERRAFRHTLKVGDVLHTSWGYEQTNVEYFEVIEVRGADVIVRELAQDRTETGFLQGRCSPRRGEFVGPPIRKRVGQGNTLKMSDFGRYAWLGGEERHWSAYA